MIFDDEAVFILNRQEVVGLRFVPTGFREVISELIHDTFSGPDSRIVNLISYQPGIYVAR